MNSDTMGTATEPAENTDTTADVETPRQMFDLVETGFNEVPKKWRKFYRYWQGPDDVLGPNEVVCAVCKVVIRSRRELRVGDRLYCMPCMSRLRVIIGDDGNFDTETIY